MGDKILLHTCCAPCVTYVNEALEKEGWEVVNIFYNPNIHPFDEYARRYETLVLYLEREGKVLKAPFPYNPLEYFSSITEAENRCSKCHFCGCEKWLSGKERVLNFHYHLNYQSLSRFISHWEVGKQIEEELGIKFWSRFSGGFSSERDPVEELKLYRQNYCGCIFSK